MKQAKVKQAIIVLFLVSATYIATGSFTGKSIKKSSDLYSLKYFNRDFYKSASIFSLIAGYGYRGSSFLSQRKEANGDLTMYSMMRFQKGNTTYLYPYAHKIIVPKFKTPAPPSFR